jgi:hypothetical protein
VDKKRPWRLSAAIRATKEKRQYVLDGVFWVPVHNLSSRRPASHLEPEPAQEKSPKTKRHP